MLIDVEKVEPGSLLYDRNTNTESSARNALSAKIQRSERAVWDKLCRMRGTGTGNTYVGSTTPKKAFQRPSEEKQKMLLPASAPQANKFAVGDLIQTKYKNTCVWYNCVVVEVVDDGKYVVKWCDGDPDDTSKEERHLRTCRKSKAAESHKHKLSVESDVPCNNKMPSYTHTLMTTVPDAPQPCHRNRVTIC